MDQSPATPAMPTADAPSSSGDALEDIVRLNMVAGVGPLLYRQLVEHFGSAGAVLQAKTAELREVRGIGPKLAEKIARAREEVDVAAELALCGRAGVRLLTPDCAEYPSSLKEIHDPPAVLYVRGELLAEDELAIAMVGSRRATTTENCRPSGWSAGWRGRASQSSAGWREASTGRHTAPR